MDQTLTFEEGTGKAEELLRALKEDRDFIDSQLRSLRTRLAVTDDGRGRAAAGASVFGSPEWFRTLDPEGGSDEASNGYAARLRENLSEDWGWVRMRMGGSRQPRRTRPKPARAPLSAPSTPSARPSGVPTRHAPATPRSLPHMPSPEAAAAKLHAEYYSATLHDAAGPLLRPDQLPPAPAPARIVHHRDWRSTTVPDEGAGPAALHVRKGSARPKPLYGGPRMKTEAFWGRFNHAGYTEEQQEYLHVHSLMARQGEEPTVEAYVSDLQLVEQQLMRERADPTLRARCLSGDPYDTSPQLQAELRAIAERTSPGRAAARRAAQVPPSAPVPRGPLTSYKPPPSGTERAPTVRVRSAEPVMNLDSRPPPFFDSRPRRGAETKPGASVPREVTAAEVMGILRSSAAQECPGEHKPAETRRGRLWATVPCTVAERRHSMTRYRTPEWLLGERSCTPRSRAM
eukprot:TRINITY_DN3854_c1_g1_i1.p1 TRINITY_DN3854_c1_g1~~TRINITY_DN3854_c1_g1_i1.p1  ORF type:complete len:458 (+),score=99.34 TRINITY_DN3854_c1_g1_i1:76-1449(+)